MIKYSSDPIFIMSSERSGSNLLRMLLGNHSNISSPPAPQLLNTLYPHFRFYAGVKEGMDRLLIDIEKIVNHPYHNWGLNDLKNIKPTVNRKLEFLDIFNQVYSMYILQKETGKKRYVCKENGIFQYYFQLSRFFNNAKFIYLVRDVRDCVASWMHVPSGYVTPIEATTVWNHEQNLCDILINSYGAEALFILYEDLISNPKFTMTKILEYVEEPLEKACFETNPEKGKKFSWNQFMRNLSKPIDKNRKGTAKALFAEEDLKMIETLSRENLIRFGYELYMKEPWDRNHEKLNQSYKKASEKYPQRQTTAQLLSERQQLGRNLIEEIMLQYASR